MTFSIIALCCVLPLAWIAWQIVTHPQALVELRLDPFRLKLLGRTLLYNGAAALLATGMAIPAIMVLGRGRGIFAKVLWLVLPVMLLLPSLAYAYGWSQVVRITMPAWARFFGMFPPWLLHVDFAPQSPEDVARCIGSLATWLWPLPAIAGGLALRRLDTQVQQQAVLDGVLWRTTLRLIAAPVIASAAMVAILAMQEFAVYEPTGISVVATEVRMVFDTGAFSSPTNSITAPILGTDATDVSIRAQQARAAAAVVTAMPLLVVIAIAALVMFVLLRRRESVEEIDTGPWPRCLDAPWKAVALTWFFVVLTVVVPTAALVFSLRVHRRPIEVWREYSPQMIGSLLNAGLTGIVVLALAFAASTKRSRFALPLMLITFLISGQLLAIALIRLYNRPWLDWVYNAPPIVVMAFVARFGWVALVAAGASWSRPWRRLREMAAVDGAGPARAALHVVWPLAWPVLGAAAVLVCVLSLTEVPATVLLSPQRPQMLVPSLMQWVHMLRYDAMIEGSLLLMSVVVILGVIALALGATSRRVFQSARIAILAFCCCAIFLTSCVDSKVPDDVWCKSGTATELVYPRGISYSNSDDTFFVVDRMARIRHIDRDGRGLAQWRMPEWEHGKPVGLTVGPDGNLYVPDTHYQRVIVYKPDGTELRRWGSYGTAPGQFIYPTDIAFDLKGNAFVSEYGDNDRVQVFDQAGKYLYQFGHFGQGDGEFSRPQSMVIDVDLVYITDACNHRIVVFKTDGTFVRNMGSVGDAPGQFRFPYGLDIDKDRDLIVCEFGNNRVQKIDKATGRGLKVWGSAGRAPGQLAYPWAVAVDRKDRIVTVDAGNNRLQVFEF